MQREIGSGTHRFNNFIEGNTMTTKNMNMKLIAAAVAGGAMIVAGGALAGIQNSKHDLSAGSAGTPQGKGGPEVCVYCHTPHGSTNSVEAPLWNKNFVPTETYTTYSTANSSTIDNSVMDVGSVSLACLSCHDGSQAMDVAVNEPGSGTGDGAIGNNVTMSGFAAVGKSGDLQNDHPIGIQYGIVKDSDFKATKTTSINGTDVYWVDTAEGGNDNQRDKGDIILYNRDFATGIDASVECASCHDPHNDKTAYGGGGDTVDFLRMSNTGSALCLACHTK